MRCIGAACTRTAVARARQAEGSMEQPQTMVAQPMRYLDKAMGALVRDLNDRGLWKNTVVVWMGEFGRTPRINQNGGATPGRQHWPHCVQSIIELTVSFSR